METKNDDSEITIDLGRVVFLLWQKKLSIIFATIICALVGFILSEFVIPPTYSASADMLVNNNQDTKDISTVTSQDLVASNNLVGTYAVILKSHNILEKVITDQVLNLDYDELTKKINVEAVDDTQVMRITVKYGDAKTALDIVNEIVDLAPDVIMDTVNAGSVKTVDSPWTTGLPVAPSVLKWTAVAGLLGLLFMIMIIVIRDMMNDTFKTEDDIRQILDLTILGIIPLEDESADLGKEGGH